MLGVRDTLHITPWLCQHEVQTKPPRGLFSTGAATETSHRMVPLGETMAGLGWIQESCVK